MTRDELLEYLTIAVSALARGRIRFSNNDKELQQAETDKQQALKFIKSLKKGVLNEKGDLARSGND